MLRNPFGIRNGKVVTISDLSSTERGAGCNCLCPNCKGPLIAKMGDIKVHHFAHSKDACDEIATFTSGLLQIIKQSIEETGTIYIPALIVGYELPWQGLTSDNIAHYVKLLSECEYGGEEKAIKLSDGKQYVVNDIRIIENSKSFAEALFLNIRDRSIAVQVLPPKTACKNSSFSLAFNISTLVLNVENVDFHTITSGQLQEIILEKPRWKWASNSKMEKAYPRILALFQERQEKYQKEKEARERLQKEHQAKMQTVCPSRPATREVHRPKIDKAEMERRGYEEVKDLFTQQDTQIRDSYGNRWVQCEHCSLIKPSHQFAYYGGAKINSGICSGCLRKGIHKSV